MLRKKFCRAAASRQETESAISSEPDRLLVPVALQFRSEPLTGGKLPTFTANEIGAARQAALAGDVLDKLLRPGDFALPIVVFHLHVAASFGRRVFAPIPDESAAGGLDKVEKVFYFHLCRRLRGEGEQAQRCQPKWFWCNFGQMSQWFISPMCSRGSQEFIDA